MALTTFVSSGDSNDAFFTALHKLAEISLRFDYDDNTLALMVISARQSIRRAREIEKSGGLAKPKLNDTKATPVA
ncbi:MAG: hypothetical protein QF926_07225 [Alphaproteobacteria bacterium]|jgi:hypothetical protein|nr:hypothetical protein [Alphaproteobacteria bacterium]MDP6516397.1 hypothetical protein [Alphaproteobacteria bacterium]|tara:strand:- start:70 stop:294 length:225 start_codon:yes stop_codon:yes gene_type:complete